MIDRLARHKGIVVAGHRGYKSDYPENTLLAFQEAIRLGVEMLEFDLRMSKDGIVVVIHDETVDRTTNGSGAVSGMTLAELKALDAGGWFDAAYEGLKIPTFEELCDYLADYPDVLLNVEIKRHELAKETADAAISILESHGFLDRCVFTCFDGGIIAYLYDTHGVKTQGFPAESMSGFAWGEGGTYDKMWAVGIEMSQLTPALVQQFQSKGLLAWCYCPDNERQVRYAMECGVTLMTCNDPFPALELCGSDDS